MTESIGRLLQQAAADAYRKQLNTLDKEPDQHKRRRLEAALLTDYFIATWRISAFAPTFAEVAAKGGTSHMYRAMLDLLLEERGRLKEAMTLISNQRDSIFRNATASKDPAHRERNRLYLQPLLQLAVLHEILGETEKAENLYNDLLKAQPDWPEALHQKIQFLYVRGLNCVGDAPESEVKSLLGELLSLANHLNKVSPANPNWIKDLARSHQLKAEVSLSKEKLAESEVSLRHVIMLGKSVPADAMTVEWVQILAQSQEGLAKISRFQGKSELATRTYAEAIELWQKLSLQTSAYALSMSQMAKTHFESAQLLSYMGRLDLARNGYERSLSITRKEKNANPPLWSWQETHVASLSGLGDVSMDQGRLDAAEKAYREALEVAVQMAKTRSKDSEWKSLVLKLHHRLGSISVNKGSLGEASKHYQKALNFAQEWMTLEPTDSTWKLAAITAQEKLVEVQVTQDKLDEAAQALRASQRLTKSIAGAGNASDDTNSVWDSYDTLGSLAMKQGKTEEALQAHREAHRMILESARRFPENFYRQRAASLSHRKMGDILRELDNPAEAFDAYRRHLDHARKLAQHDPANNLAECDIFNVLLKIGNLHRARNENIQAEGCFNECLGLARKFTSQDTTSSVFKTGLIGALRCLADATMAQKPREASTMLKECLDIANQLAAHDPSNLIWQEKCFYIRIQISVVLEDLGKETEALEHLETALTIANKLHATDPTNADWQEMADTTRKSLKRLRERLKRPGEAI